jgi:hypothetical protein
MQNAPDSSGTGVGHDRSRVILGVPTVDNEWLLHLVRQLNLGRKRCPLELSRRVVVVIIETAFANCDGGIFEQLAQCRQIARGDEMFGVVWMDTGSGEDKTRMLRRNLAGDFCRRQRLTDTNDRSRARIAGA